ncbi:MAG: hypothetical protein KAU14_04365 [Thermoplasmata archaeon]|nr:hypothetical protein [Thermoplasmata archaeon]
MVNYMSTTTLAVSIETKEVLKSLGTKGETYDVIIRRLIKEAAIKEMDSRWNKILKEDRFIPLDEL